MGPLHSEEFSAYIKEPGGVWDIALGTGSSRSSCLSGKEKNTDINVKAENREHVFLFTDGVESFRLGFFHVNSVYLNVGQHTGSNSFCTVYLLFAEKCFTILWI